MSIPLDRLYHYIDSTARKIYNDIVIYRFYPYGSRNLNNFTPLTTATNFEYSTSVPVYCYDQEPLNYDYYQSKYIDDVHIVQLCASQGVPLIYNLKGRTSIYDSPILLHSEKRSANLIKYQEDGYVTVYYWSHAVIALDWYRFAQYDQQTKNIKKTFLIFNRAWAGTREYRLKLLDLLITHELVQYCQISFNPTDPETNACYKNHNFSNKALTPTHCLENYVAEKIVSSNSSADYDIADYNSTEFELVLETLFDDDRLHLTEKIFRPIALGQPFILASTVGSLEYIKSYGFKTFEDVIDESYDTISNPVDRLCAIVKTMKDITEWSATEREQKNKKIKEITEYNKVYFFSNEFFDIVLKELASNLKIGLDIAEATNTSLIWSTRRKMLLKNKILKDFLSSDKHLSKEEYSKLLEKAGTYHQRALSNK